MNGTGEPSWSFVRTNAQQHNDDGEGILNTSCNGFFHLFPSVAAAPADKCGKRTDKHHQGHVVQSEDCTCSEGCEQQKDQNDRLCQSCFTLHARLLGLVFRHNIFLLKFLAHRRPPFQPSAGKIKHSCPDQRTAQALNSMDCGTSTGSPFASLCYCADVSRIISNLLYFAIYGLRRKCKYNFIILHFRFFRHIDLRNSAAEIRSAKRSGGSSSAAASSSFFSR